MEGKDLKGKTPPMYEAKRLFGLRRWDKALLEFLSVDAANFTPTENTELAYFIGLCYAKLGRYDEGLLYLEQVITAGNDPLRVCQCRMTLAYIYVITGRAKMAELELGQLLKSGFESAQIYTTLAYAAWTQKQYQKSVDFYEKALDLDKNNTTANSPYCPTAACHCRRAISSSPER
ncbi:hypothetical protein AGMMS49991_11760 [Spirochaetia bacterium]|nr:hypothetical protein AGMMS49991_11760 [Spirochaetia bacterium]